MVGVSGRSKACHTCKRRKKGCDQQVPSCGQCKRTGILCEGYDKARIFVHSSQQHGDTRRYRSVPEPYVPPMASNSRPHTLYRKSPPSSVPNRSPLLDNSLEHVALQSQCFDNFWNALLPNGKAFSDQATQYSTAGWTEVVRDLCQRDDLVRFALLANALLILGEQTKQQSTVVEGWRAYGRCLQMMARSLPVIAEERGDELLTASTLLAGFELLQAARGRSSPFEPRNKWFRHVSGEQAIILVRKPHCYAKGHARRLFIDSRLHLIYPSFQHRKRCVFASPEWKTIPWSLHPKDPKDGLLDILIELPGIFEDLDRLLDSSNDPLEERLLLRKQLEERCRLHDHQLQQWLATSGTSTVQFVESKISCQDQDNSAPSSEDFAMAHLGILYWATCLVLYPILQRLSGRDPMVFPQRMGPRQYCRKITLLLPYFQRANIGEFFINIAVFPTIVVIRFLDRFDPPNKVSEERKILLNAFKGRYKRLMQTFLGVWPQRKR